MRQIVGYILFVIVLSLCPIIGYANEIDNFQEEVAVQSDFEVIHIGSGLGKVGVTGVSNAEYDLYIKIVFSGVLAQSRFIYSIDGGMTWSESIEIPLSGYYVLGTTGLVVNFYLPSTEQAEFIQEDSYQCYIPNPNTTIRIQQQGKSEAEVIVLSKHSEKRAFDVLEQFGHSIQIKILKSGGFGSAVWQVSKDGGATWSIQAYAEEELLINSDITLKFYSKSSKGVFFEKDDIYTIYAERTEDSSIVTAIIVIIVLVIIFGVVIYIIDKKWKTAIPKESDYEL